MKRDIYKSEYDYQLPKELIAQYPSENRSDSKLLSLNEDGFEINHFKKIKKFFKPSDLILVNETKVFNARLNLRKDSGGNAEIFILKILNKFEALCLTKSINIKKRVQKLHTEKFPIQINICSREGEQLRIKFNQDIAKLCELIGDIPIPPYIKRDNEVLDKDRYQTIFANNKFMTSVAAPTASLHFDEKLFKNIENFCSVRKINLSVGLGTFKPLPDTAITANSKLHTEEYEISEEVADSVNRQIKSGNRVIALGTTTLRALESSWNSDAKKIEHGKFKTDMFIKEGFQFNVVSTLITNFHLPQSSLLMLVCAFGGKDNVFRAYNYAIENKLRFFSYGDAMIINR